MKTREQPAVYRIAVTAAPVSTASGAETVIWKPDGRVDNSSAASLPVLRAMRRGAAGRCPACGKGAVFSGWLRISSVCTACGAPLGEIRADDAPPYFTVFIVAHVVIGLLVLLERFTVLSVSTEMMIMLPGTLVLTLALIRPVKGATVGLMLKLGFMKTSDAPDIVVQRPDDREPGHG